MKLSLLSPPWPKRNQYNILCTFCLHWLSVRSSSVCVCMHVSALLTIKAMFLSTQVYHISEWVLREGWCQSVSSDKISKGFCQLKVNKSIYTTVGNRVRLMFPAVGLHQSKRGGLTLKTSVAHYFPWLLTFVFSAFNWNNLPNCGLLKFCMDSNDIITG